MKPTAVLERGVVLAILLVYTGAILVVLVQGDGALTEQVQSNLRLVWPPIYLLTIMLILPRLVRVVAVFFQTPLLVALLIIPIVSVLWSVAPDETLRRSAALIATTLFGIYLAERFDSYELLRLLMWMLLVCAVFSIVFAVLLPHLGVMHREPHVGAWRGVFVHKNVLGRYMVFAIVVFVILGTWPDKPVRWIWAAIPLTVILVMMSDSRTPVAAGAVALLVFPLGLVLRQRPLTSLAGLSIALALVVVLGAVAWLNFELLLGGFGRDVTLTGRTNIWVLVLEKIRERPMLGYGYVAFWVDPNGPATDVWAALRWNTPNAHSGMLELWLGMGLVGLATFSLAFCGTFVTALRRMPTDRGNEALWILMFLCLYLAFSVAESSILARNSLFWVLFVYCMCRMPARRRRPVFGSVLRRGVGGHLDEELVS